MPQDNKYKGLSVPKRLSQRDLAALRSGYAAQIRKAKAGGYLTEKTVRAGGQAFRISKESNRKDPLAEGTSRRRAAARGLVSRVRATKARMKRK